jgi:hypothetical protein
MASITTPLSTSLLFGDILNYPQMSGFAGCRTPVASWCAADVATIALLLRPVKRLSRSSGIECSKNQEVCGNTCNRASST